MEKPPDGIQKEKARRSWRQPRFINQVGPGAGGPYAMEPDSLLDQGDSYGKQGACKVAELEIRPPLRAAQADFSLLAAGI